MRNPGQTKLESYFSRRFRNDAATESRIIGAFLGVISFILPWGSVIFRDKNAYYTIVIISNDPLSLIRSGDNLLIAGALIFFFCTLLAFVERLASIGQLAGWILMIVGLPAFMAGIPTPYGLEEAVRDATSQNLGTLLGLLSAVLVLISIFVERRQDQFPEEERLPNDQRPVVRYDWAQQGQPPRDRSR